MVTDERPLLEVRELSLEFRRGSRTLRALDRVSFTMAAGETLCLVGESGSGKTVTALSLARLLPSPPAHYVGGAILFEAREVLGMGGRELRELRGGSVSYVFQDASVALNPAMRVGRQILESLWLHRPEAAEDGEVVRLLQRVGIPAPEVRARDYPHQLSGGMQQRVMMAMALASQPRLLVADEPTTALDVTIQAQVLDLLRGLQRELGMSILLITHNLGLVGELGDRVAVMYAGQIVEVGPAAGVLREPRHPYTRALLRSVPELGRPAARLESISGVVPRLGAWPAGCHFHPRCGLARAECRREAPELEVVEPGWWVRCPWWRGLA